MSKGKGKGKGKSIPLAPGTSSSISKGKGKSSVPPPILPDSGATSSNVPKGGGKGKNVPTAPGSKGKNKGAPPAPGKGVPAAPGKAGGKGTPAPPVGKGVKGKGKGKGQVSQFEAGPAPPKDVERRGFMWVPVPAARFEKSIFATAALVSKKNAPPKRSNTKKIQPNLNRLAKLFFKEKNADNSKNRSGKVLNTKMSKQFTSVLDQNRIQTIEIFLNARSVKLSQVEDRVVKMKRETMTNDLLRSVMDLYPTPEEIVLLQPLTNPETPPQYPLAKADAFLIGLMKIAFFKERADCVHIFSSFDEEAKSTKIDLELVLQCCTAIQNTQTLPAIFGMLVAIGNFMNYGWRKAIYQK